MDQRPSFGDVIPNHNDNCGNDFGDHIVDAHFIDQRPHEKFGKPEADDTGGDKDEFGTRVLVLRAFKDPFDANDVIDDDGQGKTDAGRNQIIDSGKFRQEIEPGVIHNKRDAAIDTKAKDFGKPL